MLTNVRWALKWNWKTVVWPASQLQRDVSDLCATNRCQSRLASRKRVAVRQMSSFALTRDWPLSSPMMSPARMPAEAAGLSALHFEHGNA